MSVWRWADEFAPAVAHEHRITLGEGNTPLVQSRAIGPKIGAQRLLFKLETTNPTGSYKDRFAAAAVADMLARGKSRCIATSSGNTGAALAAYCAAAGIACEIAIVETAPVGKLKQMLAYGAKLTRIKGFGLDSAVTSRVFEILKSRASAPDAQLQISAFCFSPAGMAGVRTISFEILEQTAGEVDHIFVPAGGGGLTLAVAQGALHIAEQSNTDAPAVHCVQPAGNDTIATPLRTNAAARAVNCETQISGLQVASVLDGNEVIAACRKTGGTGFLVDDAAVWAMQKRLSREEGIFCEPAGAVSVAAAVAAIERGEVRRDACVTCLITGSGFKDPDSVDRMIAGDEVPMVSV